MATSRIALLLLLLSAPAYGIHMEGHCGKKWITYQRLGYSINGQYKANKVQVTRRKSEIETIFASPKEWRILLKRTDVAIASYVTPESGRAVVRCLE